MSTEETQTLTSCGGPESTHFGTPVSFKVRIIPGREGEKQNFCLKNCFQVHVLEQP